jgi:hypothetical protein
MVTFAVTLSDLIEKGGAYAGLAAFFGLAILAVLYFAQAREIRRLREWAGRAPERALELEQRVVEQAEAARRVQAVPSRRPGEPATAAALAASKPPPAPEATPADVPTTQQPAVEGEEAAKPEETAAEGPAVPAEGAEADKPADAEPAEADKPADAEPAEAEKPADAEPEPVAEEGSPTEHPVVAASAPATDVPAEDEAEAEADKEAVPAGATTALAGGGSTAPPANGAPPEVPAGLPPRATQSPPVRRPAPAAPLRSSTSATRRPPPPGPVAPRRTGDGDGRRTPIVAAAGIAGLVLVIVGLIAIIGGGGDEPKQTAGQAQPVQTADTAPTEDAKTGDQKNPPTISRADTAVAVLNGTTVSGLAATINDRVEQSGFTMSQPPANYTDSARSASVVFYDGSANRTQAFAVGKLLGVSDVQPIIDAARTLAPGADVVVVVGADQTP